MLTRLGSTLGYFLLFVFLTHWLGRLQLTEGVTACLGVWGITSYVVLLPAIWTNAPKAAAAVRRRPPQDRSAWGVLASVSWMLWTVSATALLLLNDLGLLSA